MWTGSVNGTAQLYSHETDKYVMASSNPICVEWSVFEAGRPGEVVAMGQAFTSSDIDYTVKVEAKGLEPLTQYDYEFRVCGSEKRSPTGRMKTAPEPMMTSRSSALPSSPAVTFVDVSAVSSVLSRFWAGSFLTLALCLFTTTGYLNAYGNAARKDKHDFVIHLGDYIYEYQSGGPRAAIPPRTLFTLHDYHSRHGQYRTDPDLQLLSQRQTDLDDGLRVWRSFQMGQLLDLVMLDTRNYDRSITSLGWNDEYIDMIRDDASRTLMGSRQESWLYRSLEQSKRRGAGWRVVGNQIIFSRVFVSDLAWLGTRPYDSASGEGAIGVEFAGTAVSSPSEQGPIEPRAGGLSRDMLRRNVEMQWQEGYYRGYFVLRLIPELATAEFYGSPTVATRNAWDLPLARFEVAAGANHLRRPVAGGTVESGALRAGAVRHSKYSLNTKTGEWAVVAFERINL